MITARTFAQKHNSFWHTYFPALESYIRVINSGAYERFCPERNENILPERSYIVSETAFCLSSLNPNKNIDVAFFDAKNRLAGLFGVPLDIEILSEEEKKTAVRWSGNLDAMSRLGRANPDIRHSPQFVGCGLLSKSVADILVDGNTLVEVKCVDRTFRSTDFRQLLTYIFQGMEEGLTFSRIAVLNPRKGILFEEDLRQFIFDTSASDILEIQQRFRSAICMAGASR